MKPSDRPEDETSLVLPPIGEEILTATNILAPKKGDAFFIVGIDPYEYGGRGWHLDAPSIYEPNILYPGAQVTTGLPMEGTYHPVPINISL
jgi:hypothetical protein